MRADAPTLGMMCAAIIAAWSAGCGARSGLEVPPPTEGSADAATGEDASAAFDGGAPLADAAPDAPADAGPPPPDAFVLGECPDSPRARAREATVPVDLIWTIDSSGSMLDDIGRMRDNVSIFWDAVVDANLDVRVIFVTQAGYAPGAPPGFTGQYIEVNYRVDSHAGLIAFTGAFDQFERYLRPDAVTHLVTVTDDESMATTWERFLPVMEDLLGHEFTFHAVASERVMPTPGNLRGACFTRDGRATAPGVEYYELAEETGGLTLSICNEDWSELWTVLTERIVVPIPLPCTYRLPPPQPGVPLDPSRFRVLHQLPSGTQRSLPRGESASCDAGWWLNEASDRIELCAGSCDEIETLGGSLTIDLDCVVGE